MNAFVNGENQKISQVKMDFFMFFGILGFGNIRLRTLRGAVIADFVHSIAIALCLLWEAVARSGYSHIYDHTSQPDPIGVTER